MVAACNALGVGVYVDAVINHMADIEVPVGAGVGTAGTPYQSTMPGRFYGTQYQADDFHIDCTISNYGDRRQVQQCKLSGLPDLNTGKADVQTELHNYLQALLTAGVKGFRVDGAKHMAAQDIAAVFTGLTSPTGTFYVFQEMIDAASERVRDWEYTPNGDVTEFAYPYAIGAAFDDACGGSLSDLESRFDDPDMLPSPLRPGLHRQPRQPARPRPRHRPVHRGSSRRPGARAGQHLHPGLPLRPPVGHVQLLLAEQLDRQHRATAWGRPAATMAEPPGASAWAP